MGVNEDINNLDSAVFAQVSGLEVDSEPPANALFPFSKQNMNKLGPVLSAHYREGSFQNIAKYVFKFPKSAWSWPFCVVCVFFCGDCYRAGGSPNLNHKP